MKMDVKLRRFLVFALVVFTVGIWAPATAVAVEDEPGNPPVTDAAEATDSYWTIDDTGELIPADENEYDVHYDGKGLLVIQDDVPEGALQAIVDELGIKLPSDEDDPGLIVFTGDAGIVYGNATLTSDLPIGEGQILTVPEGATLTIPEGVTLTNDGVVEVLGSIIDAGTITLSHMPVSAQDVIADASAPLAVAFDLADVALETEAQEAATFLGDAAWTAEALRNVLKNCLEHTPALLKYLFRRIPSVFCFPFTVLLLSFLSYLWSIA